MSNSIALDQTFQQVEGNLVSDMNGEKVMLSIATSNYYNLGQVGGRIWELLSTPSTVQQIVDQLLEEYEVDRTSCENQVIAFIGRLLQEGLVKS